MDVKYLCIWKKAVWGLSRLLEKQSTGVALHRIVLDSIDQSRYSRTRSIIFYIYLIIFPFRNLLLTLPTMQPSHWVTSPEASIRLRSFIWSHIRIYVSDMQALNTQQTAIALEQVPILYIQIINIWTHFPPLINILNVFIWWERFISKVLIQEYSFSFSSGHHFSTICLFRSVEVTYLSAISAAHVSLGS